MKGIQIGIPTSLRSLVDEVGVTAVLEMLQHEIDRSRPLCEGELDRDDRPSCPGEGVENYIMTAATGPGVEVRYCHGRLRRYQPASTPLLDEVG